MTGEGPAGVVVLLLVLAATWCLGGLHGLWLAWTQEVRIDRWAGRVVAGAAKTCEWVLDTYDRGNEEAR